MGELLGSVISAMLAANAQDNANQVNYANLAETKRSNRFKEDLATSSKEDGFGNKVVYDPAARAWKIIETPITKDILGEQQKEQLAQLTEDAPRNRAAAEARDRRAKMGADAFEEAFNNYRYRPQKSEGAFEGEAVSDALNSRRAGLDEAASVLARQVLRQGNNGNYAAIFKALDDAYAGSLDNAIAAGKARGRAAFQTAQGDADGALKDLGFYQRVADDTTDSPVSFSDLGSSLGNDQSSAINQLINTIASNQTAYSSASDQLAAGLARSPSINLSGLDSLFSGGGKKKNPAVPTSTQSPDYWGHWTRASFPNGL